MLRRRQINEGSRGLWVARTLAGGVLKERKTNPRRWKQPN
jgi:hypothetical protein